jgi:mannose/cellobiose epimerase-like protein (N-acyl-D-glucosamine 2-epimerase family)
MFHLENNVMGQATEKKVKEKGNIISPQHLIDWAKLLIIFLSQ